MPPETPTAVVLPQTQYPHRLRDTLPTMYDLPSEDPEEPGLPDTFHDDQPQLLRETFQPPGYIPDRYFMGSDLNLYYDVNHLTWHKRPDWFAVLGVPRFYDGHDLRMSYVMWQEQVAPYVVVELLSPSTEDEDLGRTQHLAQQPPTKWMVYEQILAIPYYVVFSRYTNAVQYFVLTDGRYRAIQPSGQGLWLPQADVGIGLWTGAYQGMTRPWLRCYDAEGVWIMTPAERAEQQYQRAEHEQQRAEHEQQRAEQQHQRAELERQRAEHEQQRAEQQHQRAELERQRAEFERQRAEQQHQRAELERQRAERLAEQLRTLGIEPES